MENALILATDEGLQIAEPDRGGWRVVSHGLKEHSATSVIARQGAIIAGTKSGLFRSTDLGESWQPVSQGLTKPHIRWLAFHPDFSDLEFAGTEPAGIFRSSDGGDSWQEAQELNALRDKLGWWLPYSPQAGCVRGFAFHGDRGYAAVEVGGVLRSDDRGRTWQLAPGSSGLPRFQEPARGQIHADVHSIGVHPSSADLVFAATNAGLYRSQDGGETWHRINDDGYTRAFWVDRQDAEHILTAPAQHVGRLGTILESRDGGSSWEQATRGLETPWPDTMVERFFTLPAGALGAVLDNGRLLAQDQQTLEWQAILEQAGRVNAATRMHPAPEA